MATPVIRSITATPSGPVVDGTTIRIDVDALDPDARVVTCTAEVQDAAGNKATAVTTLTVGDPLTYTLVSDDASVVIVPDPNVAGRFHVTV